MTNEEAATLAQSIANVAQYYPVAIDPKTQAWLGLAMTAGALYGSRIVSYAVRQRQASKAQPAPEPFAFNNVQPLHQG